MRNRCDKYKKQAITTNNPEKNQGILLKKHKNHLQKITRINIRPTIYPWQVRIYYLKNQTDNFII
ncbi:hypothetical protein DRK44_11585 [Salmonella enterica subsp. enterica]|nr:hypothetical protein [Salmonella enterica subsp. enterica]